MELKDFVMMRKRYGARRFLVHIVPNIGGQRQDIIYLHISYSNLKKQLVHKNESIRKAKSCHCLKEEYSINNIVGLTKI